MLELQHRIKNLLAVVQALVSHTLRDEISIVEARQTLLMRLEAIGHGVDLLLGNSWQPAPLAQLIRSAAALSAERIRVEGPDLPIGPSATMMLSILLHELECNAIKHGALSAQGGMIDVCWEQDGEDLSLSWTETGGPVSSPVIDEGFGSKLLSRIAARLGGQAVSEFRPEGLCWRFKAPLDALSH
jgi:two-component sensor histidine kinase